MKLSDIHVQSIGLHRATEWMSPAEAKAAGLCDDDFPEDDLKGVQIVPGVPAIDMAVTAAREAIGRANRTPAEIGMLLHATSLWNGPEEWSPAGYVLRELGCPDSSGQVLNQGCNGMLAALELATSWIALRDATRAALITTATAVHNSPTVDRWHSAGHGIAIGDGGAALLIGRQPGIAEISAVNSTTVPQMEGIQRGDLPLLEPDPPLRPKIDVMARARENAAKPGHDVVEFVGLMMQAYRTTMFRSLDDVDIGPDDLTRVLVPNVGAAHIGVTMLQQLGLPLSRSSWDYGRSIGHVGASDYALALEHLITSGEVSEETGCCLSVVQQVSTSLVPC